MTHTIESELLELLSKLHPWDALNALGDYGDNARESAGMTQTLRVWGIDTSTIHDYGAFERAMVEDAYHSCVDNCADCLVDGISGRVEVFVERARAACQRGKFGHHRRTDLPIGSTPHGLISYPEPLPEPERFDLFFTSQPTGIE